MKSGSSVPFFVINIVLINPFTEFWLLTVAHKSVFKMSTQTLLVVQRDLRGRVSQQEMRLVLFFWLCTIKSTKESLVKIEEQG